MQKCRDFAKECEGPFLRRPIWAVISAEAPPRSPLPPKKNPMEFHERKSFLVPQLMPKPCVKSMLEPHSLLKFVCTVHTSSLRREIQVDSAARPALSSGSWGKQRQDTTIKAARRITIIPFQLSSHFPIIKLRQKFFPRDKRLPVTLPCRNSVIVMGMLLSS